MLWFVHLVFTHAFNTYLIHHLIFSQRLPLFFFLPKRYIRTFEPCRLVLLLFQLRWVHSLELFRASPNYFAYSLPKSSAGRNKSNTTLPFRATPLLPRYSLPSSFIPWTWSYSTALRNHSTAFDIVLERSPATTIHPNFVLCIRMLLLSRLEIPLTPKR
jgi:hypothetical protein